MIAIYTYTESFVAAVPLNLQSHVSRVGRESGKSDIIPVHLTYQLNRGKARRSTIRET